MALAAPSGCTWATLAVIVALVVGQTADATRLGALIRTLAGAADNGHKCRPEQVRFLAASHPQGSPGHGQKVHCGTLFKFDRPLPSLHLALYLASKRMHSVHACATMSVWPCANRLRRLSPSAAVRSAGPVAGVGRCPHQHHPESDRHAECRPYCGGPSQLLCELANSLVGAIRSACLRQSVSYPPNCITQSIRRSVILTTLRLVRRCIWLSQAIRRRCE